MIEVICKLTCAKTIKKLKECYKKQGKPNLLVVRPFYEEVKL